MRPGGLKRWPALKQGPFSCPVHLSSGPTIKYCNIAALEAFGLTQKEHGKLIGQPAPLPASFGKAYESDYSKKVQGAGFALLKAERWKLERMAVVGGQIQTEQLGLAYAFREWGLENGTVCSPGGVRKAPPPDMGNLEEAVAAQAAEVRRLKEEEGKGNKDPEVVEAVGVLLKLKAALEAERAAA